MSDRNYYSDHRVRAGSRSDWYDNLDEKRLLATVLLEDEEFTIPFKFVLCDTCCGRGKHVNPSIDSGGLTASDFDDDPDFREQYFNGGYDVTCYGCKGHRVMPEIDEYRCNEEQRRTLALIRESEKEDAEFRSLQESERRMGC